MTEKINTTAVQKIDTNKTLEFMHPGFKPLWVNIWALSSNEYTSGGSIESKKTKEPYVCLSLLPEGLREKVVTAIQALKASI